jgi:REP element-mobilizing transposase RayT
LPHIERRDTLLSMSRNILIVTAQSDWGELLRLSLEENSHHKVHLVPSGEDALKISGAFKFNLAILDANLAEVSVVDLSQNLRGQNPEMRIIICPPQNDPDHPSLSGFKPDGYLSQPFFIPDMLALVENLLYSHTTDRNQDEPSNDEDAPKLLESSTPSFESLLKQFPSQFEEDIEPQPGKEENPFKPIMNQELPSADSETSDSIPDNDKTMLMREDSTQEQEEILPNSSSSLSGDLQIDKSLSKEDVVISLEDALDEILKDLDQETLEFSKTQAFSFNEPSINEENFPNVFPEKPSDEPGPESMPVEENDAENSAPDKSITDLTGITGMSAEETREPISSSEEGSEEDSKFNEFLEKSLTEEIPQRKRAIGDSEMGETPDLTEKRLEPKVESSPEQIEAENREMSRILNTLIPSSGVLALFVAKEGKIKAKAGNLDQNDFSEIETVLIRNREGGDRADLARSVKLTRGAMRFMLYATVLRSDLLLGTINESNQPFSRVRTRTLDLAYQFSQLQHNESTTGDNDQRKPEEIIELTQQEEAEQTTLNNLLAEMPMPFPDFAPPIPSPEWVSSKEEKETVNLETDKLTSKEENQTLLEHPVIKGQNEPVKLESLSDNILAEVPTPWPEINPSFPAPEWILSKEAEESLPVEPDKLGVVDENPQPFEEPGFIQDNKAVEETETVPDNLLAEVPVPSLEIKPSYPAPEWATTEEETESLSFELDKLISLNEDPVPLDGKPALEDTQPVKIRSISDNLAAELPVQPSDITPTLSTPQWVLYKDENESLHLETDEKAAFNKEPLPLEGPVDLESRKPADTEVEMAVPQPVGDEKISMIPESEETKEIEKNKSIKPLIGDLLLDVIKQRSNRNPQSIKKSIFSIFESEKDFQNKFNHVPGVPGTDTRYSGEQSREWHVENNQALHESFVRAKNKITPVEKKFSLADGEIPSKNDLQHPEEESIPSSPEMVTAFQPAQDNELSIDELPDLLSELENLADQEIRESKTDETTVVFEELVSAPEQREEIAIQDRVENAEPETLVDLEMSESKTDETTVVFEELVPASEQREEIAIQDQIENAQTETPTDQEIKESKAEEAAVLEELIPAFDQNEGVTVQDQELIPGKDIELESEVKGNIEEELVTIEHAAPAPEENEEITAQDEARTAELETLISTHLMSSTSIEPVEEDFEKQIELFEEVNDSPGIVDQEIDDVLRAILAKLESQIKPDEEISVSPEMVSQDESELQSVIESDSTPIYDEYDDVFHELMEQISSKEENISAEEIKNEIEPQANAVFPEEEKDKTVVGGVSLVDASHVMRDVIAQLETKSNMQEQPSDGNQPVTALVTPGQHWKKFLIHSETSLKQPLEITSLDEELNQILIHTNENRIEPVAFPLDSKAELNDETNLILQKVIAQLKSQELGQVEAAGEEEGTSLQEISEKSIPEKIQPALPVEEDEEEPVFRELESPNAEIKEKKTEIMPEDPASFQNVPGLKAEMNEEEHAIRDLEFLFAEPEEKKIEVLVEESASIQETPDLSETVKVEIGPIEDPWVTSQVEDMRSVIQDVLSELGEKPDLERDELIDRVEMPDRSDLLSRVDAIEPEQEANITKWHEDVELPPTGDVESENVASPGMEEGAFNLMQPEEVSGILPEARFELPSYLDNGESLQEFDKLETPDILQNADLIIPEEDPSIQLPLNDQLPGQASQEQFQEEAQPSIDLDKELDRMLSSLIDEDDRFPTQPVKIKATEENPPSSNQIPIEIPATPPSGTELTKAVPEEEELVLPWDNESEESSNGESLSKTALVLTGEDTSLDDLETILSQHLTTPIQTSVNPSTFTCVLVPQLDEYSLNSDISILLRESLTQIAIAYGWLLENVVIHPTYIQWTIQIGPETSQGRMVRQIRQRTSQHIFERFPTLKTKSLTGNFWAPGYLAISGTETPPASYLDSFIQRNRR